MITKEQLSDYAGYAYRMKGTEGFGDVEIKVWAEVGGHGCLFGLQFPEISVNGMCWGGSKHHCSMDDFFKVLNQILRDYHCKERVVKGKIEEV